MSQLCYLCRWFFRLKDKDVARSGSITEISLLPSYYFREVSISKSFSAEKASALRIESQ